MDFSQNATGGVVLAFAGVVVYLALVVWVRWPGRSDRWPVLIAATGTGLVVAVMNLLAATIGWWGSPTYALPLPVLASFYGLWPAVLFALLVAGYRWLLAHIQRPRLVYGLIGLVVFAPFIVFIDSWGLATQRLSFGGGYAIWHDVLVGQALLWLPVLFYEVARHRWRASTGEHVTRTGHG